MKLLNIFFICIALFCFSLTAQIGQGALMAGGNVSFDLNSHQDSENNRLHLALNPQLGVFIYNDLAIGGGLDFNWNKTANTENKTKRVGFNLFSRLYAKNAFVQAHYIMNKAENENVKNAHRVGGALGYAFFLNRNLAIEPMANYTYGLNEPYDKLHTLMFSIGFQVYLNRPMVAVKTGWFN